jgi:hypothetical protein
MKVTKSQLQKIIKEEFTRRMILQEQSRTVDMAINGVNHLKMVLQSVDDAVLDTLEGLGIPIKTVLSNLKSSQDLVKAYKALPQERRDAKRSGLATQIASNIGKIRSTIAGAPIEKILAVIPSASLQKRARKGFAALTDNALTQALSGDGVELTLKGFDGVQKVGKTGQSVVKSAKKVVS